MMMIRRVSTLWAQVGLALLALGLAACRGPAEAPATQRLVDAFASEMVVASSTEAAVSEPTGWRFDGPVPDPSTASLATHGWQAFQDVTDLVVRDGRLAGAVTSATPVIRLHTGNLDEDDVLHEVRVRLRVSAGAEASIHLIGPEPEEIDRAILGGAPIPWLMRVPISAGEDFVTCVFNSPLPRRGNEIQQILLRPTDRAGATFDIESVELLFRHQYLATIASGISWQVLSEVHRETVVARSPESIRWPLVLPRRPHLDLALGTLDEQPVTFEVSLRGAGGDRLRLMERTLSTPQRWQPARVDLTAFGGQEVTLELTLHAETEGALGFWGAPAVRHHGPPAAPAPAGREPPQGVVFILADTLRPDRLEAYGHERATAPVLARFAEQGTRFSDAIAQGTWTKVSAPSIMSSLYPTSNGVLDFDHRLPSSATTLAEVFRDAGYATLGFSSVPFTGTFNNLHQGFEEMHEVFDPVAAKTARGFVDRLLPWLDDHRDVPFFVFLHVFDPHHPFRPRGPWDAYWSGSAWHQEHLAQQQALKPFIQNPMRRFSDKPNRDEIEAASLDPKTFIGRELDWYDGSIRAMDVEIGRVLERLRELGLDQRTLTVFASDHGEEFLDHGRTFHGHTVYSELTHVPLILRYPGRVPAGLEIDETVQMIDLMPTILELSGLPAPDGIQGQSAVPLWAPSALAWKPRPAISEKPAAENPMVPPPTDVESTAIVFEGWKLIHNRRPAAADDATADATETSLPAYELYDHRTDPLDQIDVAAQNPQVVERLADLLGSWREAAENQRLASDEAATEGLSQQEVDRLRALGYIQ